MSAQALEFRTWRRTASTRADIRWGLAAVGCLLTAFMIWNLAQGPWCAPHSWVQGHGAWHLLCAGAAYLLWRLYRSERPTVRPGFDAPPPVREG